MNKFATKLSIGKHIVAQISLCAVLLCAVFLYTSPVQATNYGEGVYSADCEYNDGCEADSGGGSSGSDGSSGGNSTDTGGSSDDGTTVAQTSSGLEVAINLENGQTITEDEYEITITPLNGEGSSFQKAEIYIDGVLAFTGEPDEDGTLRWLWNVKNLPAKLVRILIYDANGEVATKEFTVTADAASKSTTTVSPTPIPTRTSTDTASDTDTAASGMSGLAWAAIIFGILLVLLILFFLWRRRRSKKDQNTAFYQ